MRICRRGEASVGARRAYVLYWMTASRRTRRSFALQRALYWAHRLDKPLLVFEPLRAGYAWASDRLHAFVLQGMRDNAARFAGTPVHYFPYLEPEPGAGSGLLAALGKHAAVIVTDEFPCFFLPRMLQAAASRLGVLVESVDGNGLLPLRAAEREFLRAYDFRRYLQKTLPPHLSDFPAADPLANLRLPSLAALPSGVTRRWPAAKLAGADSREELARLPIDHAVVPSAVAGGEGSARRCLTRFLDETLPRYAAERSHPDADAESGLSPYLHFGHLSVHEVFAQLASREGWTRSALGARAAGRREGFWGMSQPSESFLDELVTWRELGYNFCSQRADYDRYESLPAWSRATLEAHASDVRDPCYGLDELERAATHDALWNAAQRELVATGRMHNYLRMLWGKKILEWSPSPRAALTSMVHLNNKYALDGRDPNSYSGIFWCLGRFDRPWFPERPIVGTVRFMSSLNTKKKLRLGRYLERWGDAAQGRLF